MTGDVGFRMPAVEGLDLQDPQGLTDYLGSLGMALQNAFQRLSEQMNDARYIQVAGGQGMETLANSLKKISSRPGDVKLFMGTRAAAGAQRQFGWVIFDGTNGTPNADDRYFKAPAADTDPGQTETTDIGTATRVVGVQGCSPAGVNVSGTLNAITLIPLMYL